MSTLVRRSLLLGFAVLVLLVAALLVAPSPIDPLAYEAEPARPLTGALAVNGALDDAELLAQGAITGPEDVAPETDGQAVWAGLEDGRIVRILLADPATGTPEQVETIADTGGRPLGLAWLGEDLLAVADADEGLLAVDAAGSIETLSVEAGEVPFAFTDDVDVGPDGTVYFSDASSVFGKDEYLYDLLEARPHGRLLAFDPVTGSTQVLMDGLHFANGVAVAPDGDFVLVNETYRYRIHRFWLAGPRAGTSEIFIDRLPGFPDGVSTSPTAEGPGATTFWVALYAPRNPQLDRLHPRPWIKSRLAILPKFLWPKPQPYGLVIGLDADGRITTSLHDPDGSRVRALTSVEEHAGHLYLGTLHGEWAARVPVPPS